MLPCSFTPRSQISEMQLIQIQVRFHPDPALFQLASALPAREGTAPAVAPHVTRGDRPRMYRCWCHAWGQAPRSRDRAACHVRGQAPQSRDPAIPHVARGDRPCDPACRPWGQARRMSVMSRVGTGPARERGFLTLHMPRTMSTGNKRPPLVPSDRGWPAP